jgi:hypothetical protein
LRCPAVQISRTILFAILAVIVAVSQSQEPNAKTASGGSENPLITGVRIVRDHGDAALEITSTRRIVPTIESRDAPPQLIIDLPNARSAMQHNRIDVLQGDILTIRTEQHAPEHQGKTPFLRIVVSFLVPYGYTWDAVDNRLMVRLKPPEDPYVASRKTAVQGPQAASLKPSASAAVVPVTSGVGNVLLAGQRFAAGSSITAGSETAVLELSRGGEVRVCPGTTVSVTPSKSNKDLMIGLSTGAMETHYGLDSSADTILTPDFRILLPGPGEFNYAISTDSRGNTCVRGLPGNASAAIVSELIGDRVYQVKPSQQAVFHEGRIDKVGDDVPVECGCPEPIPILRTEAAPPHIVPDSGSPNITLAQGGSPADSHVPEGVSNSGTHDNEVAQALSSGPETRPLPQIAADQPHVQVEAPLVFRGKANSSPPSVITPAVITKDAEALPATEASRTVTLEVQALPPAAIAESQSPSHRGVLRRIKGFFAALFR